MPYFVIYRDSDGVDTSKGSTPWEAPIANHTQREYADPPANDQVWDPTTRDFVDADPENLRPNWIDRQTFLKRMNLEEFTAFHSPLAMDDHVTGTQRKARFEALCNIFMTNDPIFVGVATGARGFVNNVITAMEDDVNYGDGSGGALIKTGRAAVLLAQNS